MAHGFTNASLRKIASGAGVTTGALYKHFEDKSNLFEALVAPCFHEFISIFKELGNQSMAELKECDFDMTWASSEQNLQQMTKYIYDNFDSFKLLLSASEKTAYENFTHMLIDMEVEMTLEYIHIAREKGYNIKEITKEEIHLLINAQFSAFFEMVLHDIPREKAEKYTNLVWSFFSAGWKEIFTRY